MAGLKTIVKLLMKCVYFNNISKLHIGKGSGIGAFSKVLFSTEADSSQNQSISIGNSSGVGRFCELHVWDDNHIRIKDFSTLNDSCKLLGDITIERYCLIGSNVFAGSGNHYAMIHPATLIRDQDALVLSTEKGRREHSSPIHIEEDCWIGFGVFIKRGVKIGRGAIIGANSVVNKDVFPYSVQAGTPCKEIKKRLDFKPTHSLSCEKEEHLPYFYRGFEQKAEKLKDGLLQKVINFSSEAIIILEGGHPYNTIRLVGKIATVNQKNELVICRGGEHEWVVSIDSENFNFELRKEASSKASQKSLQIYNTLSDAVKKYNTITFYSKLEGAVFGISTIEVIKE